MNKQSKFSFLWSKSLRCSRNLKLRNQLILIVSLQVLIILSFALALNIVQYKILNSQLSKISSDMFDTVSNKMIARVLNIYDEYFDRLFYLNGNALITFHRLYHESRKQALLHSLTVNPDAQMLFGGTTPIPDPVRIIKGYGDNDISYSFMCYSNVSAFSNPPSFQEMIGIKIQEYLEAYGQIIYSGDLIQQSFLYSYIIDEKINNVYPCLNRGKGIYSYIPEKRAWYKELKRNYESRDIYDQYNFSFTTPYLLYTYKTIGLSMALPIVDENLELIGGVASNFLGKRIIKNLILNQDSFQVMYLVSSQGIMIMHPYDVTVDQLPLYFYNQTITGFNLTDWNIIEKNIQQENKSCLQTFQKTKVNIKCLYNSLYDQEMIVGIQDLEGYQMKLIILVSKQDFIQFTENFNNDIEIDLENILQVYIFYLLILFVIICFCIILFTKFMFYPLEYMKKTAINKVLQNSNQIHQIPIIYEQFMSNEIGLLFKSYRCFYSQLELVSLHKTQQCKDFEVNSYPQGEYSFVSFLKYFSKHLNLPLRNQQYSKKVTQMFIDVIKRAMIKFKD